MSFRKLFASLLIGATAFSCSPVNFNAMQDATPVPGATTPSETNNQKPGLLSTLSHLTKMQRVMSEDYVLDGNIEVLCPNKCTTLEGSKLTIDGENYIGYLISLGKTVHCPCCGKGLNIENFAPINDEPETKNEFSQFKKSLETLTTWKGKLARLGVSIWHNKADILLSTVCVSGGISGGVYAMKKSKEAKKANAELFKLKQEVKDSALTIKN